MDPAELRADIPACESTAYLNTGASSPSPRRVVEAATETQRRQEYETTVRGEVYPMAKDVFAAARERIAEFLGTGTDDIALTNSTADGIATVAAAIDWQPGDVVVRTDLEHPAGTLPFDRLAEVAGVEVRVVSTDRGRLDLDDLKTAVRDARLVCLSSLSWTYGTRLPVAEVVDVAHDAGARVLVDAVQSPGQVPVDVTDWGADFVAGAGHKWLLGVWGAGFLSVDGDALDALSPRQVSYMSVDTDREGMPPWPGARRLELGTRSIAPHAALCEAMDTVEAVGLDTVQARIERLTDRLKAGLGDRLLSPREYESGLVTFAADDPERTVERLLDAGVVVRELPEGTVRASVHVFNTAGDIDRLLDALA